MIIVDLHSGAGDWHGLSSQIASDSRLTDPIVGSEPNGSLGFCTNTVVGGIGPHHIPSSVECDPSLDSDHILFRCLP